MRAVAEEGVIVGGLAGGTTTERSDPSGPSGVAILGNGRPSAIKRSVEKMDFVHGAGGCVDAILLRPQVVAAGPRLTGSRPQTHASSDRRRARQHTGLPFGNGILSQAHL
jgi:hypothetical protein